MTSRDPSNERPAAAAGAAMAASLPRQRKPLLSSQASEESAVSRISDSHIPDLESTHSQQSGSVFRATYRPTAGPVTVGGAPHDRAAATAPGNPAHNKSLLPPTYNPFVVEKKNQVLDQIAKQKKATKEAKGKN